MAETKTMEPSCSESDSVPGNDTLLQFQCNPCQYDEVVSEGVGYCLVCKEYLCRDCLQGHKRSKALRQHDILTGSDLQHAKSRQSAREPDEFCPQHADMKLDYYCQTHDIVLCRVCRSMAHLACTKILPISDVCKGIREGDTVGCFFEEIQSLIRRADDLQKQKEEEVTSIGQQKEVALEEVTKFRQEVDSLFDRLEAEMRQNIDQAATEHTNQISDHLSALAVTATCLQEAQKRLQDATDSGENQQIFIAMKSTDLRQVDEALIGMGREHPQVQFRRSKQIEDLLSALKSIGTVDGSLKKAAGSPLPAGLLDMKIIKTGETSLNGILVFGSIFDCYTPWITGSIFLPDDSSLLCDHANSKLKLLDRNLEYNTNMYLEGEPRDLAMLNAEEVIVSLPKKNEIEVVNVPTMKRSRTIKVERQCYGLAVSNDQILVSCHDNPGQGEVLVLNLDGAVLRRFGQKQDGSYMFHKPLYLALNKDEDKIYVSDVNDNNPEMSSVSCITRADGAPVFTCRDTELPAPLGLAVDTSGRVVVCDFTAQKFVVLTPDGRKEKTILSRSDGLLKPYTFSYRDSDRTLVVGVRDWNNLLVYRAQ